MIKATVRYKLPPHIDHDACGTLHKIAPDSSRRRADKQCTSSGARAAGGAFTVRTWRTRRRSTVDRGSRDRRAVRTHPQIDFYEVFRADRHARGTVELFEEPVVTR